jgi:hypothetical protein
MKEKEKSLFQVSSDRRAEQKEVLVSAIRKLADMLISPAPEITVLLSAYQVGGDVFDAAVEAIMPSKEGWYRP